MRLVLRLPVKRIQDRLLLLSFTGSRSGRRFTVPLSYVADADGSLLIPGGGVWKRNLRPDRPVEIRLWGQLRLATPEIIAAPGDVERLLPRMYHGNPRAERFVGVPLGPDGRLDPTSFAEVIREGFVIVRLRLEDAPPVDPAAARSSGEAVVPGSRLAWTLAIWVVVSAVVGSATFAVGSAMVPASTGTTKALTAISVFEVYVVLLASLYAVLGRHDGLQDSLRARYTSGADIILAMAVGALCWGVAATSFFVVGQLGSLFDALMWIGSDGGRLGSLDPVTTSLSVLRACVLAPIAEELLFRGALFGWLRSRSGARFTILTTAALFGAIHILPTLMPVGFVLGLGLGWVRERTGSTVPGVVVHITSMVALVVGAYLLTSWH